MEKENHLQILFYLRMNKANYHMKCSKRNKEKKYMKILNKRLDESLKKNNKINVREGYQRFEVKQKVIQNPFLQINLQI